MIRTHDAGALRAEHVGQTVTLAGWVARRRDHGGVAFLDLREASGVVQVVVRDEEVAHSLRSEFCIKVTGEVVARKAGNENPNLATGEIEVVALPGAEGVEVNVVPDRRPAAAAGVRLPAVDHPVGVVRSTSATSAAVNSAPASGVPAGGVPSSCPVPISCGLDGLSAYLCTVSERGMSGSMFPGSA